MPEPTYTLEEARAELARQECRHGHDYEHVETPRLDTGRDLTGVFCPRCGRTWPIAAPGQQPADAEQVRAEEAERALARVRALHRVHRCAVDGHRLARTPTPCGNDGLCSCGHLGACPTAEILDTPEGPHVRP